MQTRSSSGWEGKRVGRTARKSAAGSAKRKTRVTSSAVRSRVHRAKAATSTEVLVANTIKKWSAEPESTDWTRRMKTASRAAGGRPSTHNIFDMKVGEKVKVLTGVSGKERKGEWVESRVVAVRQLRLNHPKVTTRQCLILGEQKALPSSVVVVEEALKKKNKKSKGYLKCVHDWQAIPSFFFNKKHYAILEVRHIQRTKRGQSSLVEVGGRPADMLSQSSNGSLVKVKPRGRVVTPGRNFEWHRDSDSE